MKSANNFDILKRLNRLERAVFGPQAQTTTTSNGISGE